MHNVLTWQVDPTHRKKRKEKEMVGVTQTHVALLVIVSFITDMG